MKKKLLHTPEGVRDIYNEECAKKLHLQQTIHDTLKSYGYEDIQTPTFEFFDIFSKEHGSVASNNMYKFFDREGYTLVLRPDMTPAIARAVSKYYMDEDMPVRFCYMGETFVNHAEHQGKLKEITQIGAELVGDNKSDADAEILAMTIDSVLKCGLEDFRLDIGHVDYFHGLMEASGLNDEQIEELMQLLENKNFFGVEELITSCNVPEGVKEIFTKLPELSGSIEVITKARGLFTNEKINNALDRLEKVYKILEYYGFEKYVSFDLGTIANFDYYTGIIFKVYTYGTGNPIARGGRYDNLLRQFGKDAASIGFAIDLDQLLIVLSRQKIDVKGSTAKTLIIYDVDQTAEAVKQSFISRDHGIPAVTMRKSSRMDMDAYVDYCKKLNFDTLVYITGGDIIRKEF
ncbi:MAG: ATP phosphoribosyltransferase regulatory subunit [Lachnospiraceae bacterium]|nr:ATP phosphoribosyltransferase regulatory subunit [Lachnospiraceae bacterium]